MVTATDANQPPSPQPYASSPFFTVVLIITLLLILFVGLFFLHFFCRCFLQNLLCSWHLRNIPSGTPVGPNAGGPPGFDPLIMKSFPTFTYSSVKEFQREKYGLKCAICLCEFKDEDLIRLLTTCCHVFHQECIDLWLELHKSSPVCCRSLATKTVENVNNDLTHDIIPKDEPVDDSVSITIKDDPQDKKGDNEDGQREAIWEQIQRENDDATMLGKFSRSKSTGHSLVRSREQQQEDDDKFKLRLPEHVTAMLIRGHTWTQSCTTFRELEKGKNYI